MKKIYALIIASVFIFNGPLALAEESGKLADNEASIHLDQTMKIKSKFIEDNLSKYNASIKAHYPQIVGFNLSPAAQQFNQIMQKAVDDEINRFKIYVKEDLVHMQTLPYEVRSNSLNIDYDIDVLHPNKNTIIMVRMNVEGMQAGRAHPYHTRHVFNYDLTKGKVLELSDLFKPDANFLKFLSEYSRKQLMHKSPDKSMVDMINQGTEANANNFKNWNIQNDTLLLTFDEYQVAPYANGPQEVEIPYSALKHIIASDSVIGGCVQSSSNCG
jgi:hypothetical protein